MDLNHKNESQQLVNSDVTGRPPVSGRPERTIVITSESDAGTLRLVLRLALGSMVLGREELNRRFQVKQAQLNQSLTPQSIIRPEETAYDRRRYALEGALVQTSETVSDGLRMAGTAANAVFRLASRLARPVTSSRVMKPVRRQFDRFETRGEQVVQTWINTGRSEEYLSRTLVQDTSTEIIEEVLDYLAVSPEMDQLVEQQTSDLTGDMVEELQERTTRVFVFRNWFRRSTPRR